MPIFVVAKSSDQSDLSNVLVDIMKDAYALLQDSYSGTYPSRATFDRLSENLACAEVFADEVYQEKGLEWT